MKTFTSVLEQEYFLEFPVSIREQMNIKAGDHFFTYKRGRPTLVLARERPNKSTYCNEILFREERGAILSFGFLQRMRVRPGDELVLNVEDGKIIIQKKPVIPLFPSENRQGALELKLKRELDTPPRFFSQSFREDIYSVLTLTKWSDELMSQLILTPDLLREVAWALHNDDVFSAFFEQRTIELTLELMEKSELF